MTLLKIITSLFHRTDSARLQRFRQFYARVSDLNSHYIIVEYVRLFNEKIMGVGQKTDQKFS